MMPRNVGFDGSVGNDEDNRQSTSSLCLSTQSKARPVVQTAETTRIPSEHAPLRSSFKKGCRDRFKDKRHVHFTDQIELISYGCVGNDASMWVKESDHDICLNDAIHRAQLIDQTMECAAINESCYNSSTGLTSPQVLKEYLSNPEEVIGIEHHLVCQSKARSNIKRRHIKTLLNNQHLVHDSCSLAKKLKATSDISAYMAHERAIYAASLE